jgi:hypothetical protein
MTLADWLFLTSCPVFAALAWWFWDRGRFWRKEAERMCARIAELEKEISDDAWGDDDDDDDLDWDDAWDDDDDFDDWDDDDWDDLDDEGWD